MAARLDHLVVVAQSLEQGAAWCEAMLGIAPGPGGRHALMSTHNRLFSIATPSFPRAYFEIIAIDPEAPAPGRARWFDMDDPALQAAVAAEPRLVHWVLGCDEVHGAVARLAEVGLDPGQVLPAERQTPHGLLRWRITVRKDGQRLMAGALPTLIEWGETHPADAMPASGVSLERLVLGASPVEPLRDALTELSARHLVETRPHAPALEAVLRTPKGLVHLKSPH